MLDVHSILIAIIDASKTWLQHLYTLCNMLIPFYLLNYYFVAVALSYSVQIIEDGVIPITPFDIPMDALVSPAGFIPISGAALRRCEWAKLSGFIWQWHNNCVSAHRRLASEQMKHGQHNKWSDLENIQVCLISLFLITGKKLNWMWRNRFNLNLSTVRVGLISDLVDLVRVIGVCKIFESILISDHLGLRLVCHLTYS